jgi:3-oxoacyl-[acyl-carrier protein] reductase
MCRLFWPLLKAAQGSITTLAVGLLARRVRTFRLVLSVNAAMGNFSKALSQLGKRDGVNAMSSTLARPKPSVSISC